MSQGLKYLLLVLILSITAVILLWPDFHPEGKVLGEYYWQADVLIHSGYFFLLTLFIHFLKFKIKSLKLFLLLGAFSMFLELMQHYSYKRSVSVMDAIDNLIGIAVALFVGNLITYIRIKS